VEVTHLERRGKNVEEDHKHSKNYFKRKEKRKDKNIATTNK
jgi:hypothetical protein